MLQVDYSSIAWRYKVTLSSYLQVIRLTALLLLPCACVLTGICKYFFMATADFDLPIPALQSLILNSDKNIKKQCLEYIMSMTGLPATDDEFLSNEEILSEVIRIALHNSDLCKLALECLINIASSEEGANAIFNVNKTTIGKSACELLANSVIRQNEFAEHTSNVLTNMTRWERLALNVAKVFIAEETTLKLVFEGIRNKGYNPSCPNLSSHFSQLVGNLTQSVDFQKYLLSAESGNLYCSILPLINIGESVIQRLGVVSTIYNCLFNSENHLVLLESPFNILSCLLYPLAGPEEFDEDEVEKLPVELQYLESDKKREVDPEVRRLLLKSLLMLCDSKQGRILLREQQTYLILREYHKWEKDPSLILACENVVDILIRTEEEIGLENLSSVDVPEDLKQNFEKMDADFVGDGYTCDSNG